LRGAYGPHRRPRHLDSADGTARDRCRRETYRRRAQGAAGGTAGLPGRNLWNDEELPAKVTLQLAAGNVITVETPGGGGYGVGGGA
jgi:N-methylhydantoinase B/oxoprolinase/acetone carboxylase alpha subunit